MKTAKEREAEFRADLKALLEKHGAELDITDDGASYGMQCGVVTITMYGHYKDGEMLTEFTEFNL